MKTAKYWNEQYNLGNNISEMMREDNNIDHNSQEVIEMAYELQSGSYIKGMQNEKVKEHKYNYSKELSEVIKNLSNTQSILEVGIGEGTTLCGVMQNFDTSVDFYGFDLSFSRVSYARKWLNSLSLNNVTLSTGEFSNIPFLDNSIDIVYTSHSIEPNRGKEEEILKELYRITKKYLILLEPAYELTNDKNKKRMDEHKYCKDLANIARKLGYKVIKHELFKYHVNDANPTAIIIIEKDIQKKIIHTSPFACPLTKTPIIKKADCYYSEERMSIYPLINEIGCLRIENAILATRYEELTKK